jgi:hypothetical protein
MKGGVRDAGAAVQAQSPCLGRSTMKPVFGWWTFPEYLWSCVGAPMCPTLLRYSPPSACLLPPFMQTHLGMSHQTMTSAFGSGISTPTSPPPLSLSLSLSLSLPLSLSPSPLSLSLALSVYVCVCVCLCVGVCVCASVCETPLSPSPPTLLFFGPLLCLSTLVLTVRGESCRLEASRSCQSRESRRGCAA